jgi:hypothetical protein
MASRAESPRGEGCSPRCLVEGCQPPNPSAGEGGEIPQAAVKAQIGSSDS